MDVILVNIAGLGLIGLIIWYFWLSTSKGTTAAVSAGGIQETRITVRGGYAPDTIRVQAGRPVRLVFDRHEADPCSERVGFDAFGISAELPTGTDMPVEFTPAEPGEYEFACQMGMLRGKGHRHMGKKQDQRRSPYHWDMVPHRRLAAPRRTARQPRRNRTTVSGPDGSTSTEPFLPPDPLVDTTPDAVVIAPSEQGAIRRESITIGGWQAMSPSQVAVQRGRRWLRN